MWAGLGLLVGFVCYKIWTTHLTNTGETNMSRDEIVSKALSDISTGQAQVLADAIGAAVDQSAIEQKASDGTLNQGDLDAAVASAVAAAVAPLNDQIAALTAQDAADVQAGKDALAALSAVKDALQAQFDSLSVKEGQEASVISGLQGSLEQMKNVVSLLTGILAPPAPVEPPPADPIPPTV